MPPTLPDSEVENLAQQATVRVKSLKSSGSGTIVRRSGHTYTVLTNWHVVAFNRGERTIVTGDGKIHQLLEIPRRLGNTDLAIVRFRSTTEYKVPLISDRPTALGEPLLAAGFPAGAGNLTVARGFVKLLLPKSLPQGYSLGYTNEVTIGMSGGPIFDAAGCLVGINGRGKYREPDFGVYAFEDGSEPTPELLEKMVKSSWGIPIGIYLQFVSSKLGNSRISCTIENNLSKTIFG
ncbi:MAG: trypsin-like peptidase domain-containing protein [Oscillatoriales cyanobacterium RU_3_3]|nr:trypsin-like peptidase domain-containing protein [Microcoleus sp. SU_5_6]NJL66720.1 trypsin-like peptidase domain-containing protein [Microcoleus sp. SM1_3_4]NJM60198.1 trypsin-like peptidase domain-containing protein [Oscillatoriales cyanobacterium RU_3_3]NJR23655.1 trypsin-like peptidase domain-containing protein [Richelia sp. CSU_2_1]